MVQKLDLKPDQRTPEIQEALKPGPEAVGYALAQSAIAAFTSTSNQWGVYAARLSMIDVPAREAFTKNLRMHLNNLRIEVETFKADPQEYEIRRKAKASATIQVSNLVLVAKALNAGYFLQPKTDDDGRELVDAQGNIISEQPFYVVLSECRLFLQSEAAGDGRGRPKKPWLDKLKAFILNNQPDFAGDVDGSVTLVMEMAKLTKKAQQAKPKAEDAVIQG